MLQDFLQPGEILRNRGPDPRDRQPGSQPQANRWVEGHVVRQPRRAGHRLQPISDAGTEGSDPSSNRQALATFEDGDFEAFLALARDRAGLAVGRPYSYRARRGLPGLLDGVVLSRHILEIREEREDLLGPPADRDRVLERFHRDLHPERVDQVG